MLQCSSDVFFKQASALHRKGFTIDDTTLQYCPQRIPELWPNSEAPASSLRLFRSWNKGWKSRDRQIAWRSFAQVLHRNGIKVLIAAPVTCDAKDDELNWRWTKEFMTIIGPDNVMGVAVGNELELLFKDAPENCIRELWDGRFWSIFQRRVADIDAMGFEHTPVTSVFTGGILYTGFPFQSNGDADVNGFLTNATKKYGRRYTFTFNIYPYLDPNLHMDPGSNHTCNEAMQKALCWKPGCLAITTMVRARRRMSALTGREDDRFWIGEIGWSSPVADTLASQMRNCPAFSSVEALSTFYGGFLRWDLSIGREEGKVLRPPDHVFYFTLRDALNFGQQEHFGLMTTCESSDCKIFSANWTSPTVVYAITVDWLQESLFGIFILLLMITWCIFCIVRCGCVKTGRGRIEDAKDNMSDSSSTRSSIE